MKFAILFFVCALSGIASCGVGVGLDMIEKPLEQGLSTAFSLLAMFLWLLAAGSVAAFVEMAEHEQDKRKET